LGRGRNSPPTPLPPAFKSWEELYEKWETFRTTEPRSYRPSRADRFCEKYNIPLWLIGTLPFIFRSAQREDEVGDYAKAIIEKVRSGEIGVPNANNLIRKFAQQSPRFRTREAQVNGLDTLVNRLRDDASLAQNIRNINNEVTDEEIEQYLVHMSKHLRALAQLKSRLVDVQRARRKEG
jgi:hypothetical protein